MFAKVYAKYNYKEQGVKRLVLDMLLATFQVFSRSCNQCNCQICGKENHVYFKGIW